MNRWNRTFFALLAIVALFALFAACSNGDSSGEQDPSISDKMTLSGYVQKGPFSKGAKVSLQPVDVLTLQAKGNAVEGVVLDNEGAYSIDYDEFDSPYALLTAKGTFHDEITGKKTKDSVTLHALVNLIDRIDANVNLLTHLEYMRVLYLVNEESMTFFNAKKQAEREVFAAFAIEGDFEFAEDLDISGDSDGDAALHAISLLMLGGLENDVDGDRPFMLVTKNSDDSKEESKLGKRLADFVNDFIMDGTWKNSRVVANMADWAEGQSNSGKLRSYGKRVASYIDHFWWKAYGLDVCDSAFEKNDSPNLNLRSKYAGVYFECHDGKWVPDTTRVRDSINVKDSTGVKDTTSVADTSSVKDTSSVADTTILDTLSDFEKDTKDLKCASFGQIAHGVVDTSNVYFCDGKEWKLFDGDENVKYYKLEDNRDGRIYRYVRIGILYWMAEDLNYGDEPGYTWDDARQVCPTGWHLPGKEEWNDIIETVGSVSDSALDTYGLSLIPDGQMVAKFWTSSFDTDSQGKLVYTMEFKKSGISLARQFAKNTRLSVRCVKDNYNSMPCNEATLNVAVFCNKMSYSVCSKNGWIPMSIDEYNEFYWSFGDEGETRLKDSNPSKCMVYESGAWHERDSSNCTLGLGACTAAMQGELSKSSKSAWYTCDNGAWKVTSDSVVDQIMLGTDYDEGAVAKCPSNGRYCVFQDGRWREGTKMDSVLTSLGGTPCMVEGDTSKVKYEGEYYVCRYVSWRVVHMQWETAPQIYNDTYDDRGECSATGLYGDGSFHNKHDNATGRVYVCENGGFRLPTEREMILNMGCMSYNYNKKIKVKNSHFICTENGWVVDSNLWEEALFTDPRDGKEYRAVGIWDQVWMGENLNYTDSVTSPDLEGNRWCYGGDSERCETYGSLYSCEASKNVCPAGWHLPTYSDWQNLLNFMTLMDVDKDKGLRSNSGWQNYSGESMNGTDVLGFTALPGGAQFELNHSSAEAEQAWFWYDSECKRKSSEAFVVQAGSSANMVSTSVSGDGDIAFGFYVRCVKD